MWKLLGAEGLENPIFNWITMWWPVKFILTRFNVDGVNNFDAGPLDGFTILLNQFIELQRLFMAPLFPHYVPFVTALDANFSQDEIK